MWRLEFTYLVNPASGFGFQLVSLTVAPFSRWGQGAVVVGALPRGLRRMQCDGRGRGERAGEKKNSGKCLRSTFGRIHHVTCLVFPPLYAAAREQSAAFFPLSLSPSCPLTTIHLF